MEEHDDDIERLFQSAARRRRVDFDENDWSALEARLDAARNLRMRRKLRKLTLTSVVALLLCNWPVDTSDRISRPVPTPEGSAFENKLSLNDSSEISIQESPNINRTPTPETSPNALKDLSHNDGIGYSAKDTTRPALVDRLLQLERQAIEKWTTSPSRHLNVLHGKRHVNLSFLRPVKHIIDDVDLARLIDQPRSQDSASSATDIRGPETQLSRISFVLSLAPDFTATRSAQFSPPASAFGLFVNYRPYNALSVSAGAVAGYKIYRGEGREYRPPSGYWQSRTNGIVPESIDGACYVIEIPVVVQYNVIDGRNSAFFISGGVSSYFILNEVYKYEFDRLNVGAKTEWRTANSSTYLFNTIIFSVGYEYAVFPQLSIGIEPYIKIPIQDVGWPKVRLYSTGTAVTFRYKMQTVKRL